MNEIRNTTPSPRVNRPQISVGSDNAVSPWDYVAAMRRAWTAHCRAFLAPRARNSTRLHSEKKARASYGQQAEYGHRAKEDTHVSTRASEEPRSVRS
jgi:hypothetical protein